MTQVREIAVRGGTVLGSNNKTDPTRFPTGKRNPDGTLELKDVTALCAENLRRRGVDALVAIGGDGVSCLMCLFVKAEGWFRMRDEAMQCINMTN